MIFQHSVLIAFPFSIHTNIFPVVSSMTQLNNPLQVMDAAVKPAHRVFHVACQLALPPLRALWWEQRAAAKRALARGPFCFAKITICIYCSLSPFDRLRVKIYFFNKFKRLSIKSGRRYWELSSQGAAPVGLVFHHPQPCDEIALRPGKVKGRWS